MKKLIHTLWIVLATAGALYADNFSKGVADYEAQSYPAAAENFESAAEADETSAARHNLALSQYQAGKKGEAAWQLERAIRLQPFNAEYRYKIEALRESIGLLPRAPRWYELFAQALTLSQWTFVVLGLSLIHI